MHRIIVLIFAFSASLSSFAQSQALYEVQDMITGEVRHEEYRNQNGSIIFTDIKTKEVISVTNCTNEETRCTTKSKYMEATVNLPINVESLPLGSAMRGTLIVKEINRPNATVHIVTISSIKVGKRKIVEMRSGDGTIESKVLMSEIYKMPFWAENKIFDPETGHLVEHEVITRIDVSI